MARPSLAFDRLTAAMLMILRRASIRQSPCNAGMSYERLQWLMRRARLPEPRELDRIARDNGVKS